MQTARSLIPVVVSAAALALAAVNGCGKAFETVATSSTSGATSGTTGQGGASASGGGGAASQGGGGASSSSAGGAGQGGAGGGMTDVCGGCKSTQYCDVEHKLCSECSDFSRFHFGAPIALPNQTSGARVGFAREAIFTNDLWFTLEPSEDITTFAVEGAAYEGTSGWGSSTSVVAQAEAGLYVHDPSLIGLLPAGTHEGILLYDSTDGGSSGRRLYAVPVGEPPSNGGAPIALDNFRNSGGDSQYSVAYAELAGHAYWMEAKGGGGTPSATLYRATTKGPESLTALPVSLILGTKPTCVAVGPDFAPWVTPKGDLLLFQAPAVSCLPSSPHQSLYSVALTGDGKPNDTAVPLYSTDLGYDAAEPSLTTNFCELLFTSLKDGNREIYAAKRD